jgi:hypothetical protein
VAATLTGRQATQRPDQSGPLVSVDVFNGGERLVHLRVANTTPVSNVADTHIADTCSCINHPLCLQFTFHSCASFNPNCPRGSFFRARGADG